MSRHLKNSWLKTICINIQGGIRGKIGELEDYMLKNGVDIAAVQEARLPDGVKVEARGYRTFRHGRGDVLFFVRATLLAFTTEEASPEDEDQMWIRVKGKAGGRDLFLCCAHMPQESENMKRREEAFAELQDWSRDYLEKGEVIILGDLNARPGRPTSERERRLIGLHGQRGNRTGNGRLMVRMMSALGLVSLIGQTPSPHDPARGTALGTTRRTRSTCWSHRGAPPQVQGRLHPPLHRSPRAALTDSLPEEDHEDEVQTVTEDCFLLGEVDPAFVLRHGSPQDG